MQKNAIAQLLVGPTPPNSFVGGIGYPSDSKECIFFGRAIDRIARAKFGAAWTGREPYTSLPELLPDPIPTRLMRTNPLLPPIDEAVEFVEFYDTPPRRTLMRANELLARHSPEANRPLGFGLLPVPLKFTITEWKSAQRLAQNEHDAADAAMKRFIEVMHLIVALSEAGRLKTKLRPLQGGDFSEVLPEAWWRTENYVARFLTCRMHPSEPFRTSASPEEMHYIYVTRASLKTVVAELTGPSKNEDVATGARYRSEYMRCMDRVIEELDITDDHQPKKVSVEEAIQRNWTGAIPLSPTDVKHLASFIRNPDSRAGRNRTKSG